MWLGRARRKGASERGQVLILLVGAMTVILVIAAIVIDFGLWFSDRRDVQRAADFAALAGAQDLLNHETAAASDGAAMDSAYAWAEENGFVNGEDGVVVEVSLVCQNDLPSPPAGICYNANTPGASDCVAGAGCDALSVTITKPAERLFTQLFGIDSIEVTSGAAAVAGLDLDVQLIDTTVLLQAGFSMGFPRPPCGTVPERDEDGCPRLEAKAASHAFVDILAAPAVASSQVAYIPYTECYGPNPPCMPSSSIVGLTSDSTALHDGIEATRWVAQGHNNICVPLLEARRRLTSAQAQAGPGVRRAVVLLSDGENFFTGTLAQGHVPCWPDNPSAPIDNNEECPVWNQPSGRPERDFDRKAYLQAQALQALGAEIYVVALNVCGGDDGRTRDSPGYCAGIGDTAHDNVANQRLLKCIVSEPDHYLPVETADELPEIFALVAARIAGRGLLR